MLSACSQPRSTVAGTIGAREQANFGHRLAADLTTTNAAAGRALPLQALDQVLPQIWTVNATQDVLRRYVPDNAIKAYPRMDLGLGHGDLSLGFQQDFH